MSNDHSMNLTIAGFTLRSRLFLGTGKFGSLELMRAAVVASGSELVTVALKRVDLRGTDDAMLKHLDIPGVRLLPNTSGVRTAQEAVLAAQLAREALETDWVKLEIHPDPQHLLPDPIETLHACELLARDGFIVLPYVNADPVLCRRLQEVGAAAVMPLGAPIGSNQGLQTKAMLEIIIDQSQVPVIIDAGLGAPSHAAAALELGADAVLVNTAIAVAGDPVEMAQAFKEATIAGYRAHRATLARPQRHAVASSPLVSFLDQVQ